MLIHGLEITEEPGGGIDPVPTLPIALQAFAIPSAVPSALEGDGFQILFLEFRGKGFSAWYSRYWIDRALILRARSDLSVLELRIGITNQLRGTWDKIAQPSLKAGQFNLSFTPHVETRATFEAGKYYATFDIHVEPALLEAIGMEYHALRKFLNKVDKAQPAELATDPPDCPAAMLDAVQFILNNPYSAKSQPQFLEWNIKQILLVALETMVTQKHALPFVLSDRDIEGLYAVRQTISDYFPKWPDMAMLCRKGGLNEFKLKAGFKHLFQVTAYAFHLQLKFREARRLLLETKDSMKDIAFQIGYDHPSSFAYEFKKQFGYTASWFQKHGRL
jgi:AraC family transcriptional activator of pyochelin receptor